MNRLREVTLQDRIKDLGLLNKYVIEQIYVRKGNRVSATQFSAAIKKRPDLRQPREKEIAELAESVISEMEAERKM
ncbi:hypothetical protein IMSAG013_01132 [Clostridiales bacterium]|nr:hypothetical protein IMSAG013_01132 [Clostridiales bacterium]